MKASMNSSAVTVVEINGDKATPKIGKESCHCVKEDGKWKSKPTPKKARTRRPRRRALRCASRGSDP
jgi:hypothetical protein